MRDAITHLNYVSVLVVAVAGFLLGWLWYGLFFGRVWMAEMKFTPESMAAAKEKGMAGYFIKGFTFTLLNMLHSRVDYPSAEDVTTQAKA